MGGSLAKGAIHNTRLGKPGEVRGVEVERYHHEELRDHRRRWLRGRLRVLALLVVADRSVTEQTDAAPRGSCRVVLCCVHACPECQPDGKRYKDDAPPGVALAEAAGAPDWHVGRRRLFLPLAGSWHITTAFVAGHVNTKLAQAKIRGRQRLSFRLSSSREPRGEGYSVVAQQPYSRGCWDRCRIGREMTGPGIGCALLADCMLKAKKRPEECRKGAPQLLQVRGIGGATVTGEVYVANLADRRRSTATMLPQAECTVPKLRAKAASGETAPGHGCLRPRLKGQHQQWRSSGVHLELRPAAGVVQAERRSCDWHPPLPCAARVSRSGIGRFQPPVAACIMTRIRSVSGLTPPQSLQTGRYDTALSTAMPCCSSVLRPSGGASPTWTRHNIPNLAPCAASH